MVGREKSGKRQQEKVFLNAEKATNYTAGVKLITSNMFSQAKSKYNFP